ncbi:hypothetical protein BP422_11865 [Brevibacillus formosus]|uniref:Peptidase C-terminal archaeal/bacterial domain-containing protein n=1 Tax=Brevibacillus formosus TaxID=54913 RepID=A0A220MHU9_9BACL|nr:hypothetical protein [Brevibacillus formosus]ASJ54180.1 hypothetical protein BP422_11865 [Brevibacillus formosus]
MFKNMLRNVLCASAVISALTFGSQAAFANDIVQNQEKQSSAGGQIQAIKNQKDSVKPLYDYIWFRCTGLTNAHGWQTTFYNAKLTVNFTRTVTLQVNQTGNSPDVEYIIFKENGSTGGPTYLQARGSGPFLRQFVLEPGTYFVQYINYSKEPVDIYGTLS